MKILDTHCHINDDKLYPMAEEVIQRAKENGVIRVYNAGDSLPSFERILDLHKRYPSFCKVVLGIHPEFASESDEYFEKASQVIEENKGILSAIGEIGLDYHYDKSEKTKNVQKKRFIEQIRLAKKRNLPIVIHARDADFDTLNIIKEDLPPKIDLHCFSGSAEIAKEYCKLPIQVYFGVGGVSTFKNAKTIKEVIQKIPLTHFLSETDSPYLAPTPHRGEKNEPCYLPLILEEIALLTNKTSEEVAAQLLQNGEEFYGERE